MRDDPAVKKALEAACSETFNAVCTAVCDVWPEETPIPDVMPIAAAAIAAFLRALPPHHMRKQLGPDRFCSDGMMTRQLAAAVTAAAQEARDA